MGTVLALDWLCGTFLMHVYSSVYSTYQRRSVVEGSRAAQLIVSLSDGNRPELLMYMCSSVYMYISI